MSSYFDTMAGCVGNDARLLDLVVRQFRWYLRKIMEECWQRDLERLRPFQSRFFKIEQAVKQENNIFDPGMVIQDLHTIAHDLARVRIRLRGGRHASDNPPIPY